MIAKGDKGGEADAEISADNYRHFGEPVYEYDLAQGIDDGYLAACEIIKGRVNLDENALTREDILRKMVKNAVTGGTVSAVELKEEYDKFNYEGVILLPDRVQKMCEDHFRHLCENGGPELYTQ